MRFLIMRRTFNFNLALLSFSSFFSASKCSSQGGISIKKGLEKRKSDNNFFIGLLNVKTSTGFFLHACISDSQRKSLIDNL